jgi:hypothetical protein
MARKLSRLPDDRIIDTAYLEEGETEVYVSPDDGWMQFEGSPEDIAAAQPITDKEKWYLIAWGDLDLYRITPEARKRMRTLEKAYRRKYPDFTPGTCRESAFQDVISEAFLSNNYSG